MKKERGTISGRLRRLLPCALFLVVITGMTGAAELFREREILFPEAAAIALGALAPPRLAWRTDKAGILVTIALCACIGVVIVRFLPLPLAWQLAAAYLAGQLAAAYLAGQLVLLAMLIPEQAVALYPMQALCASAVYILSALLYLLPEKTRRGAFMQ